MLDLSSPSTFHPNPPILSLQSLENTLCRAHTCRATIRKSGSMDANAQRQLYFGVRFCSLMLSGSAALIDAQADRDQDGPTRTALRRVSRHLHAGIDVAQSLLPHLRTFAQTLASTGPSSSGDGGHILQLHGPAALAKGANIAKPDVSFMLPAHLVKHGGVVHKAGCSQVHRAHRRSHLRRRTSL